MHLIQSAWQRRGSLSRQPVAGGGIQGGRVVGASDDKGGEPAENPKTPQDVLATMYRHLGIDTRAQYEDHSGRPHPVLSTGNPIEELFS